MTPAQRGQLSGAPIERKHVADERSIADLQRERSWLARQKLELLELYDLRLRLKAQLYSEKYSPNQPRVPKGNSDGGQWTSYGDGSGRGGRVQVADLRSGRGGINDQRVVSDADPEQPLNGRTAAWYRGPSRDPLEINNLRVEGVGGGGGRGGFGSSPPSYSTGGGTIYTTPRGESIVAPKGYVPSEATNKKGLVLSPKGQEPNNNANIIRYGEPRSESPNGYFRYYNNRGQPINPLTGKPGSNNDTHIPPDFKGPLKGYPGSGAK